MAKKRNLTLKKDRESTFDLIVSLASENVDYGQEDSSIGKVLAVQTSGPEFEYSEPMIKTGS